MPSAQPMQPETSSADAPRASKRTAEDETFARNVIARAQSNERRQRPFPWPAPQLEPGREQSQREDPGSAPSGGSLDAVNHTSIATEKVSYGTVDAPRRMYNHFVETREQIGTFDAAETFFAADGEAI